MVRKKSAASKAKKRKEALRRKSNRPNTDRLWRILILIMKAVRIFLNNRRDAAIAARLPPNFGILEPYFVPIDCVGVADGDVAIIFPKTDDSKEQFEDFKVVEDIVKKLVSKASRREYERIRQIKLREKLREEKNKSPFFNEDQNNIQSNTRKNKQCIWVKQKYHANVLYRQDKTAAVMNYFRRTYQSDNNFHRQHNARMRNRYLNDPDLYEKERFKAKNEYNTNDEFRERRKTQIREKYQGNSSFREKRKSQIRNNYQDNDKFRQKRKNQIKDKYQSLIDFRDKRKDQIRRKYRMFVDFREKRKDQIRRKYQMFAEFRNKRITRIKAYGFDKYHNNISFRSLCKSRTGKNMLKKYHHDAEFRMKYKEQMREKVLRKYRTNHLKRLRMINQALNHYRMNYTPMIQTQRRLYNQKRRILKKYIAIQSHVCKVKHSDLYMKNLNKFRELNCEGPDYICVCCRLALFRNQVMPYSEEKYTKKTMSYEIKERIQSYSTDSSIRNKIWICRYCSDKLKRGQTPSRAIVNKLETREIPSELKELNNLEKHLISLRLPFLKIVNLSSGKTSGKFAQKGTKGPLHCVPSNVMETITTLPRPIDKSMMVRLQLKRRLKYKTVWEEQLINPNDVRDALLILTKIHPGYKNININEIDENYLTSDKSIESDVDNDQMIESMDVDVNDEENTGKDKETSEENQHQRMTLDDINKAVDSDEEIDEDNDDIRTKYNIGADSCTQPADFNDFLFYDKNPCVVAPAEKNKLSSLLIDKSIEALAFPHLFPDGKGTYDEERVTDLKWKEYCKTRLFSSDSRFASDSTYIFYLQYLGDLKQVFSSINVAFRKKLPMTVKNVLDEGQMKFLMKKDMIYRYLQSVRGSPQYWHQRLKDLFGMTRQLSFPTFFVTLSCADLRWKEFINTFARHSGTKVKDSYTFEEKTKLLRANPVLAARLFEKRFTRFMNMFIKGGAWCLGKVRDWYARIEMQFRGSPHAHMPIWIEDAPKYTGVGTDKKTREEIVLFCDKYITTRFPSIEEDTELHHIIKEVQTHSRNHSKSCLKHHRTICRFGFPRPIARRTFICEPIKIEKNDDKERSKRAKKILSEMNATMNTLEKERILTWSDFDNLLSKYNWTYDEYEWALRIVHTRAAVIHRREPNARWVNQYNEEMIRAWDANMDIQFVLDAYACAKYLMSYTTKPEREMSLLLEETHKECREGNMSVREEMKKLTGTFFNHRQVSVQEAIYRATKMPLVYSSRGFVFVPSHSNSCKFLKSNKILKQMDPEDDDIYMSNLADKYFDRPDDPEFDICLADFASQYEIVSINRKVKNPKTPINYLKTLQFGVKKRCGRNAIIRYPYFNLEIDRENYFENLLSLYLPIRNRSDLEKPYELYYETGEIFDAKQQLMRKVKDIIRENRKKYEAHFKDTEEMECLFNHLSVDMKEDEWAEIVAQKEKEKQWLTEMDADDNPDLNVIHKNKNKNTFLDLKPRHASTNEIKPLLESMNEEQQQIFYHVRDWCVKRLRNPDVEPLRLFITGGAGTGKSHLLKCLHYEATKIFSCKKHLEPDENIDEIHTLITAFTGAAAVNVGGVTIHSAFGIGTQKNSLCDNLSCDRLNSYRCKLGSLKLLFVDEVSLIQASLWGAMHSRLTQIMGTHSNTMIFGNIAIIAIGDFYQCSPVASQGIYSTLLWSDHFEYVELKINERQKTNCSFAQMLNRIRKLKKKETMAEEDLQTLEKCYQRYLNKEYHPEALHLFAKNTQVDAHNDVMIEMICTNIRTFYEVDGNDREIKSSKDQHKGKTFATLRLAKNARVMITKNIAVNDGLANGVLGRVVDFVESENKNVSHVVIKCDLPSVGRLHRTGCSHCREKDTVCIVRENDNADRQDNHFSTKKSRKQFPLRLSWAVTIHKAQGITVDQVVMGTKDLFGAGMGYTGLTRVRTEAGLFLTDLHLDKIYCNENIDTILSQMKTIRSKPPTFRDPSKHLNVLCHNIEGLKNNFHALRNHYLTNKADMICLSETWLDEQKFDYAEFEINDFRLFHRTRFNSFDLNHPLKTKKGGGIAMYVRENISTKEIEVSKQINLEYLSIEIEKHDITLITCYRSPQQNKNEFLTNLIMVLEKVNMEKKILLVGDLNEDSLHNGRKTIELKMESLGFRNLFKVLPTTKTLTSLDCVYSNFSLDNEIYTSVVGTHYSYHDELMFSVGIEHKTHNITQETISNVDNRMEIDCSSSSSTLHSSKTDNMKKRERISTDINPKKKRKVNDVSSSIDNNKTKNLKERQMSFLRKLDKKIQMNDTVELECTLDPNEQLDRLGFKKINMLGDGNCFFRAVSHLTLGYPNYHMKIRAKAVDYVRLNRDFFEPFLERPENPTMEHYLEQMSRNRTYVDNLVIVATAINIKKNIIIHESGKVPFCIPGSDFIDDQIHLWYKNDLHSPHYDSVKCINDDPAFLLSDQLIFR